MNKNRTRDYVLLIHEYAAAHLNDNITPDQVYEMLEANGISMSSEGDRKAAELVLMDVFYYDGAFGAAGRRMRSEAYYRHMDYLEMVAAKKNTKEARVWSIIALTVSAILAGIQVWAQFQASK